MSTALVKQETQVATLQFSEEQRQMIRDVFANGATDAEFQVFMEVARLRRLNPITRQIHLVKRYNSDLGRYVQTPQTGIDGLRAVAERTGEYDGQDEPEFIYDEKKKLTCAKVKVYRKGVGRPAVGVAHFSEYAGTKKDGSLTSMWATKPHIMLAKCAEALALRKAFPEDTGGLYTDEEMPQPHEAEEKPRKKPERAAATVVEVVEEKAAPPSMWQRIKTLADGYDFPAGENDADLKGAVKAATGKSRPAELTEEDFVKIEAALAKAVTPAAAPAVPENDIPF